jgi:hypothetical protein
MAGASGFEMPSFRPVFGFFRLLGIPFVLVGLSMLLSPFWMLAKARRTAYVITNRRAILLEGRVLGGLSTRSFDRERLRDVQRVQFGDGSGNLVFERQLRTSHNGGAHFTDIGFLAVPDVKDVEDRIRELFRKTSGPT